MTIHQPTPFRSLVANVDPNSLVAARMAAVLQERRVRQGRTVRSRVPLNLSTTQSAQDLQSLIQSALDLIDDDGNDNLTMASPTTSSKTSSTSSPTDTSKDEEKSNHNAGAPKDISHNA